MSKNTHLMLVALFLADAALASGSESAHGIPFKVIIFQTINVLMLVGLLFYVSRKKVASFLLGRAESHNQAKIQAKRAMEEAEEKHREVSFRLRCLQDTEESSIQKAKNDALELKSKLIKEAEQIAKRLVEDAKKTAIHEHERAKKQVEQEALDQALAGARAAIKAGITAQDQSGLKKHFVDSIGAAK